VVDLAVGVVSREPVRAVLLDAFGTLVLMDPPAPRLRALLAAAGHHHPEDAVARAIAAEIRFYRAEMHTGGDPQGLARLRRRAAGVIAGALGPDVPPPDRLTAMLVDSLRFRLAPDALGCLDALDARGLRLAVVSNWDCALPDHLAALGIAARFEVIAVSAVVGAAKPSAAIFRHALAGLGVPAAAALHCGDRPDEDCAGARAAGMRAVLLDRAGALPAAGPCPVVRSLRELPLLIT
jgi:putative hydrolase of the HAD superfamily